MSTHNLCFRAKIIEAVLMSTHNLCFRAKIRTIFKKNSSENEHFTAVKYCCILHGRVCVMIRTQASRSV